MPDFSRRSSAAELMDEEGIPLAIIGRALKEIERINKALGGFQVSTTALKTFFLKKYASGRSLRKISVSDWGCGSGDLLRVFSKLSVPNVQLVLSGLDRDEQTIRYAREHSIGFPIRFYRADVMEDLEDHPVDIVSSCLFSHHFHDKEWIMLVKKMYAESRMGVIINDLHRNWFAYYSIKMLTRIFRSPAMVQYDAPLSVLRGFKRKELHKLLADAGISSYRIRWKWAFRWQIILFKEEAMRQAHE